MVQFQLIDHGGKDKIRSKADADADSQASLNFSFAEGDQMVQFGIQGNDSYAESENDTDGEEGATTPLDSSDTNERNGAGQDEIRAEGSKPRTADKRQQVMTQHKKNLKAIDDEMAAKLHELHGLMEEGGLVESAEILRKSFGMKPGGRDNDSNDESGRHNRNNNSVRRKVVNNSNYLQPTKESVSEDTIYTRVVKDRQSSSTEEIDTSDECINISPPSIDAHKINSMNSVTRQRLNQINRRSILDQEVDNDGPPGTSKDTEGRQLDAEQGLSPQERAEQMIRDAENAKARIMTTPGKVQQIDITREFVHSVMVDESYSVVAAHVDEATYDKIIQCKYVDFAKLIPKDKIHEEEDNIMQLVWRNGRTFYAPVKEGVTINSFNKWEQAFRVFANIYTQEYPHRSAQLIQYNHVIHDIAQTYLWSNVYAYDKDFRIHMAKNPRRSWGIILQQSWSMRLKERLTGDYHQRFGGVGNGSQDRYDQPRVNEPCRRYNRGKCTYGVNCKFEHRCSYCYKYGHGMHNCRRVSADRGDKARPVDSRYER